jgi:hypothetical protein
MGGTGSTGGLQEVQEMLGLTWTKLDGRSEPFGNKSKFTDIIRVVEECCLHTT